MSGGSCIDCGAPLASDQAACPICALPAQPAGGAPVVLKAPAGLPIPPQMATLIAVFALGFGGVVGSTLSGGLGGLFAAAAEAPATTELAEHDPGTSRPSSGGSGGGPTADGPTATAPTPAAPVPVTPLPTSPPLDPLLDPPSKPPKEEPDAVGGTVVRVNALAESYSVAAGDGTLVSVHAPVKKLPEAGIEIRVPVETLFNTTSEEAGLRKERGESDEATFSGTVTHVDENARAYVISSAGASVVVTVPDDGEMPVLASSITVDVGVEPTAEERSDRRRQPAARPRRGIEPDVTSAASEECQPEAPYPADPADPGATLVQKSFEVDFETLSYAPVEGVVQAVCDEPGLIVVSADDLRQLGADLVLSVPKQVHVSGFEPGDSITAAIDPTPGEDGSNDLWGIAGDDGADDADDEDLGQGDLAR